VVANVAVHLAQGLPQNFLKTNIFRVFKNIPKWRGPCVHLQPPC